MKIFKADKDNDLCLDSLGDLAILTDKEALAQLLEHKMQSLLGEMMFNTDKGLPYQECIWNGAPNLRQFESFARRTLKQTQGVKRVLRFAAVKEDNTLFYEAVMDTVYGGININGTV